jgi:hypothetical protein
MRFFIVFCVFVSLQTLVLAGEMITIQADDNRKNIDLSIPAGDFIKIILRKDQILLYDNTIHNNNLSNLIVVNPIMDNLNSDDVYNLALNVFERFLKKFRPVNLKANYLSISFRYSNGSFFNEFVALDKKTIRMLDNRDWGTLDFKSPKGKLPFKEAIKQMVVFDGSYKKDASKTQNFKKIAKKYSGTSPVDSWIESVYYKASSKTPSVTSIEAHKPLVSKGGDQVYQVQCSDGSYGLANKNRIGTNLETICGSPSSNDRSKCKAEYEWSLQDAVQWICEG